jgi:Ferritin-like domain
MANTETQILDEVLVKNRRKMLALGGTALAALILRGAFAADAAAAAYSDADILNFALNLEFLEANYYYLSAFGCTIDAPNAAAIAAGAPAGGIPITGAVGTPSTVSGGSQVPFTTIQVASYAIETAIEEGKHVLFLQSALGSQAVAQPAINLGTSWPAIATAAGIPNGASFTPYANDDTFLVGAYVFEDVGVTAYHGAAPLLTSSANLSAAAGILSVEAYHAGLIRTTINAIDPTDASIGADTNLISTLRAALSLAASPSTLVPGTPANPYDMNPDDYGLATFTTPSGLGTGPAVTATRITDADPINVIAFARTTTQVLNIVTGGGAVSNNAVISPAVGLFFPAGLNAGPNGFR